MSWFFLCRSLRAWPIGLFFDPCGQTVFAGKDASRALGKSSTKAEDVSADWEDLDENEQKTLDEWIMFFAKRYNVVGVVAKD